VRKRLNLIPVVLCRVVKSSPGSESARSWSGPLARSLLLVPVLVCAAAVGLGGCGGSATGSGGAGGGRRVRVVAAENFWGSIASQLGGSRVLVKSVIVNPDTDPHSYEPTASDGVGLAESQMAIVNGIGYDAWASKLIDANPSGSRVVLSVGDLLGHGSEGGR
jgi:zinc/manganese transport system substrate-binding protein